MYDAHVFIPFHLCRQIGAIEPREDINAVPHAREFAGDIRHVNILPTAVDTAQLSQRGRMFANDCDSLHAFSPLEISRAVVLSPRHAFFKHPTALPPANYMPVIDQAQGYTRR